MYINHTHSGAYIYLLTESIYVIIHTCLWTPELGAEPCCMHASLCIMSPKHSLTYCTQRIKASKVTSDC